MKREKLLLLLMALAIGISNCGCTATRRVGQAMGNLGKMSAYVATRMTVEGLIDGIGSDETLSDKAARERRNEAWKDYWRANPNVNPKMTEAYADD